MNSMAIRRYKSVNAMNPKGGYREPSTVTTLIPNHKNGHYVRPNKVALKLISRNMLIQMLMLECSTL
jgi:hypothetical protein